MAMIPGLPVLAFMAAVWALAGLALAQAGLAAFAVPLVLSALTCLAARSPARHLVPRTPAEESRIGKLVGLCSLAEGAAFVVFGTLLASTGKARLIPAALAVIVGLHFLPLARGMPRRLYYATGGAMAVTGSAGLLALSPVAVALACAAILWATCLAMIAMASRLRPAEAVAGGRS